MPKLPLPLGLFAAVLWVGLGCGEGEPRRLDELVQREDVYLDPADFEPYDGPVYLLFSGDTSRVELETNLKDGRFNGPYRTFYRSGAPFGSGRSVDGEWHGPFESLFEDGRPWMKGTYDHGVLSGSYEEWDEEGAVAQKGTYKGGAKCGAWEIDGEVVTYDACGPT